MTNQVSGPEQLRRFGRCKSTELAQLDIAEFWQLAPAEQRVGIAKFTLKIRFALRWEIERV
jgi:hypothetical protein